MTRKRTLAAAGAALAVVLLVGFTAAGCGHHRGHRDPAQVAKMVNAHLNDVLDDLDATPAQREKIHALADQVLADAQKLHAGQADAHQALLAQWDAATPDAAQVHALIDQRIDALRAIAHEAADAAIQAHGVLTPEQRAKVSKKIHRHSD